MLVAAVVMIRELISKVSEKILQKDKSLYYLSRELIQLTQHANTMYEYALEQYQYEWKLPGAEKYDYERLKNFEIEKKHIFEIYESEKYKLLHTQIQNLFSKHFEIKNEPNTTIIFKPTKKTYDNYYMTEFDFVVLDTPGCHDGLDLIIKVMPDSSIIIVKDWTRV